MSYDIVSRMARDERDLRAAERRGRLPRDSRQQSDMRVAFFIVTISVVVMLLTVVLLRSAIADSYVLSGYERDDLLDNAAAYHYKKTKERRVTASACFFDPQVEGSMDCRWSSASGGADGYSLQQQVKRRAKRNCKSLGGKKCILFSRNGKMIKGDVLSAEVSAKLESILAEIPSYDSDAVPLPTGSKVASSLRSDFEEVTDWYDDLRKKDSKLHYVLCAGSNGGPWTVSVETGRSKALSGARNTCILKCKALKKWFDYSNSTCHLIYEDGKFVNTAARDAVTQ